MSDKPDFRARLGRFTVSPFVHDPQERNRRWGLPADDETPGDYIVELNLRYAGGVERAAAELLSLCEATTGERGRAVLISRSYYKVRLSARELRELAAADEARGGEVPGGDAARAIYKIWPDFPVRALIDRSVATVKADAAVRAFEATGDGIVWAILDSGIDATHIHFGPGAEGNGANRFCNTLLDPSVAWLHRDFTQNPFPERAAFADDAAWNAALDASIQSALRDDFGHGTHVAGIVAGGLAEPGTNAAPVDVRVCQRVFRASPDGQSHSVDIENRAVPAHALRGVAPQCRLISLKVLDQNGCGSTSSIMRALRYIRENLNEDPKLPRVHGVNLSLGYEFDAEMFACGQSPLCVEVDRLVKSGVVVVAAAGNTGYGAVAADVRYTKAAISNSINDPGNAGLAITVGSAHRDSPHTYGVSFFSSKGPTADGRLKPDLVAPGERITSAAAASHLRRLGVQNPPAANCYIDDSGTSMAAPHVSGAIAAFLSVRREFIGQPEEVKKIFLDSATPLGRERYFEGHGLVDVMRAIQSV